MKPQFTLKKLFAVCLLVAGLLGAWRAFVRSAAMINEVAKGEELIGDCFTVGCADEPQKCKAIFRVGGRLSARDSVLATLYTVQQGAVRQVSSMTVAAPADLTPDFFASGFDFQFALCERDDPLSPALTLGVAGHKRRAAGSGSFAPARRRAIDVKVLSGPVPTGRAAIAYVEGDNSVVQPIMTVPAFAESNSAGDYIVVTVQMVCIEN